MYIVYTLYITVCPGSSDTFYVVTYYIKWVTTSWTYSMCTIQIMKITILLAAGAGTTVAAFPAGIFVLELIPWSWRYFFSELLPQLIFRFFF